MQLELYREDLDRQFQRFYTVGQVRYEHFTPHAQAAIVTVGQGIFWMPDRVDYQLIEPPTGRGQG